MWDVLRRETGLQGWEEEVGSALSSKTQYPCPDVGRDDAIRSLLSPEPYAYLMSQEQFLLVVYGRHAQATGKQGVEGAWKALTVGPSA